MTRQSESHPNQEPPVAAGPAPRFLPHDRTGQKASAGQAPRLLLTRVVGLVVVMSFFATACNRAPVPPPQSRPLIVLGTLYPLADIARQIGGDRVRADWMLSLGDPIDAYVFDRHDVTRLAGVDLILADSTVRTETWAQNDVDRLRDAGGVATFEETPDAWRTPPGGLLLLDPHLAGEFGHYLAKVFSRQRPADGPAFRQRATAFTETVDRLVADFKPPADASVVVTGTLFDPFLARVNVRSVPITANPLHFSREDAEDAKRVAAESGARAMLVPLDTPPGTLAYLEELTGLRAIPIDPLGHANYPGHSTYTELLRFNLDQLRLAVMR